MEDYKLTWETLIITPENTSLESLRTGFVHELAELFKDDEIVLHICGATSCSECKISNDRFSDDVKFLGDRCSDCRHAIIAISTVLKMLEGDSSPKKPSDGICKVCKYCIDSGDYKYCKAWHNFTTETMTCGYFDKKEEKESEELDK